jgi:hypothetical protein
MIEPALLKTLQMKMAADECGHSGYFVRLIQLDQSHIKPKLD